MKFNIPKLDKVIYLSRDWNISKWTKATDNQLQEYADSQGFMDVAEIIEVEGNMFSPVYDLRNRSNSWRLKDTAIPKLEAMGWKFDGHLLTSIPKGTEAKIVNINLTCDDTYWMDHSSIDPSTVGGTITLEIKLSKPFTSSRHKVSKVELELAIDAINNLEYEDQLDTDTKGIEHVVELVDKNIDRFTDLT